MDDVYQINVAKSEFREAYNTGDVDRLIAAFSAGGFTDMSKGRASKFGSQATARLREQASSLFASHSVKLTVIIIDIAVHGDTAHDYGWYELILKPKSGGETIRKRYRYFELWSKNAQGSWKISFHINNQDVREELGDSMSHWFLSEEQVAGFS
jgi:ketosteroid isomerase-like protein